MPSFVNVGARVDSGTMVDTWVTVGSCAQIGKNCHLSGGVGIGGVLEPIQAGPVIIEDDCFIGARSEVVEGVVVERGSVLSMGVYISASTKIIDRATGEVHLRPRPGLFGGGPRHAAGQAPAQWRAGPRPLLRRDRQAGRREDAGQDLHQRAAAGLILAPIDPGSHRSRRADARAHPLPQRDAGRGGRARSAGEDAGGRIGFPCWRLPFQAPDSVRGGQSLRPLGRGRRPRLRLRRPYRCGARGRCRGLEQRSLRRRDPRRPALRPGRRRHEGGHRLLRRRGRALPRPARRRISRPHRLAHHRRRGGTLGQRHQAHARLAEAAGRAPRCLLGGRADQSRGAWATWSRSAGAAA